MGIISMYILAIHLRLLIQSQVLNMLTNRVTMCFIYYVIHDYRRHIINIVWKMYSSRDNSGKFLSKSKYLNSIRASKLYQKRQSFVNLTTEDHNYCHRSIKNHSNSAFLSPESKIQSDSDTECQNEETIRESDINLICATQNLPTDLVDLDYSRLIVELGVLAKQ